MRFGEVPLPEALGAILAHSEALPQGRLRKGQVLGPDDLAALAAAGLSHVTVARPDPDDLTEDAAAAALAAALAGQGDIGLRLGPAFTGRVNLHATRPGLVTLDPAAVDALNMVDPAITLATLPPLQRVTPGTLVGTVKIITYAVAARRLSLALTHAAQAGLRILPVQRRSAALILTEVPGQDPRLGPKARRAVETRLRALGMTLAQVTTVPHQTSVLARAMAAALAEGPGAEMLLILTGSATSDATDTAPMALTTAGGQLQRFGIPVDPGNLLFTGELQGRPVIGLPGCARSLALNGADWVLERLACGLTLTASDFARMGVGGLLKEIPHRPQPREKRPPTGREE